MFTGIIESTAPIKTIQPLPEGALRIEIISPFCDVKQGESIAVNGVCLTVENQTPAEHSELTFFVSPETLARSNLSTLTTGELVNLERAMRLSDRLSGHLVQGHVDTRARLLSIEAIKDGCYEIQVHAPKTVEHLLIEKGSVCLDGISLTINKITNSVIYIMIVPHTWRQTNLFSKQVGRDLNMEVDMVSKHLYAFYSRSH